jgi:hypothetical protein
VPVSASDRTYVPLTYTCGGCDNRWSGVSRAHCSGCHRTFAGFGPFDRHRRELKGEGICVDPNLIASREHPEIRQMFLTDGIWSSVAEPKPRGRALAAFRAARAR